MHANSPTGAGLSNWNLSLFKPFPIKSEPGASDRAAVRIVQHLQPHRLSDRGRLRIIPNFGAVTADYGPRLLELGRELHSRGQSGPSQPPVRSRGYPTCQSGMGHTRPSGREDKILPPELLFGGSSCSGCRLARNFQLTKDSAERNNYGRRRKRLLRQLRNQA